MPRRALKQLSPAGACLLFMASAASAQVDTGAWPQFRANHSKTGSVENVPGPATKLAWSREDLPIPSPAGFTVASSGDIYYKSHDDNGSWVYRLDRDTGATLAQSPELGGAIGAYGGVLVTQNAVFTTVFAAAGDTAIVRLNKTTLAVQARIEHDEFQGLRGTPLISSVLNASGNYTLYVVDRNAIQLHAVDAATGALRWSYDLPAEALFGGVGPMWVDGQGRQVIAHFGNAPFFGGSAVADNGDGTFEELWVGGPDNFNWWGSGALSADGSRIYVTTFNDDDFPPLWAIDVQDGGIIWDVPGFRGDPSRELNFFARPAVIGDRIYCVGGHGVITCFQDQGSSADQKWEFRDGEDEFTVVSAAAAQDGNTYVYAVRQGLIWQPNRGELVVLRDDGNSFTEIHRTDLDGAMLATLYSNNSATIDGEGSLYVGGGNAFTTEFEDDGAVYKFEVGPGGGGLSLAIAGECPGQMALTASGATPGRPVAFIYARGQGSVAIPPGRPCAGVELGLDRSATLLDTVAANAEGVARFVGNAPAAACGNIFVQALDVDSCAASNVQLVQ